MDWLLISEKSSDICYHSAAFCFLLWREFTFPSVVPSTPRGIGKNQVTRRQSLAPVLLGIVREGKITSTMFCEFLRT